MATNYNPRIVTNGLVLCLDAGNIKSYPGTGTTWTDISGNGKNGTLTNGPTYSSTNGGSIVFDGVDDYVTTTGSTTTTEATFVAWLNRNGTPDNYDGIMFTRVSSVTGMDFTTSSQLGYTWNDAVNTYSWNSGLIVPNLTWCLCAVSVNATTAVAYLGQSSGITSATNTVTHTSTTFNTMEIGRDTAAGARVFKGNIAQALLYNRALTAAEIAQNFNALRGRFGV